MTVDVIRTYLYVDIIVMCPLHHALMDIDTATEYNLSVTKIEHRYFPDV